MNKRIIYPADDGGVAVVIPAAERGLSIEEIAAKDVPVGRPYKIIDASDLPADREFRHAWTVDIEEPDGVGADYGVGSTKVVIGWTETGEPILEEQA